MSVEHAEARLAAALVVELFLAMVEADAEEREDELPDCDTSEPVACAG